MTIGPLSGYGFNPITYSPYAMRNTGAAQAAGNTGAVWTAYGTDTGAAQAGADVNAAQMTGSTQATGSAQAADGAKHIINPGQSTEVQPGKKTSPAECETCKNRKYVDGSDEMVSFKSPQHISPEAAATRVAAHEQEHVSNAYTKASQDNGQVISCSVAIHTSVCPECGRTYVSGGTTSTSIKYSNESNPYIQDLKAQHADAFKGQNMDFAV